MVTPLVMVTPQVEPLWDSLGYHGISSPSGEADWLVWASSLPAVYFSFTCWMFGEQIDGLVQERCNSIANALELHLSCTNPPKWRGIYIWCCFLIWKYHRLWKFTSEENDNVSISHSQYCGCWWSGDISSHGISSHDADLDPGNTRKCCNSSLWNIRTSHSYTCTHWHVAADDLVTLGSGAPTAMTMT